MVSKAQENRELYLRAPTWEEIDSFVGDCGVSMLQFERFFSIPKQTLYKVKEGSRELPAAFWHVIYEKKIPVYATQTKTQAINKEKLTKKVTKSKAGLPQEFTSDVLTKLSKKG